MVVLSENVCEVEGNLIDLAFEGRFDLIAHGCNCHKIMGAGIAKEIKERIPEAYDIDYRDSRFSISKLGCFSTTAILRKVRETDNGVFFLTVLNLYTQYNPGANLDYEALTLCLRKVNMMYKNCHIGLPYIGAGIAGGDWNRILLIIKEDLKDMKVTIVKYKKNEV